MTDPNRPVDDLPPERAFPPESEWLSLEPPPIRPGFVRDTLAAVQRDRAARWRSLMLRYEVPEPSADFVARTLAALAQDREPPRRARVLQTSGLAALAAAAAVALAVLWPDPGTRPRRLQQAALDALPQTSAAAFSPTPIAALVAMAPGDEPGLLLARPADGLLLLMHHGGR